MEHLESDLKRIDSSSEYGTCFSVNYRDYHFECLMNKKKQEENENLYVLYNGIYVKNMLPRFPRWAYHNMFSGSMLCFEDPMYYKYPELTLGWLWGTPEESLIEISTDIVKTVSEAIGISNEKIIFCSSSGGGYDSIFAATFIPGSMAIGLNPQLYIQNYVHTENYIKTTGYDLSIFDSFLRNNILQRIRQYGKTNKFVMVFNTQCERDMASQAIPFMEEMGIEIKYGISTKDNVLMLLYDCDGLPDPHLSWETRSIFLFIDSVAKKFKDEKLSEDDKKNALIINDCWHDIYSCRKENMELKEKVFVFDSNIFHDNWHCISYREILIIRKNTKYNYFRMLLQEEAIYLIKLSDIEADYDTFSICVYDFEKRDMLFRKEYSTSSEVILNLGLKNNKNIALLIYAGIYGKTNNKELRIGKFIVTVSKP